MACRRRHNFGERVFSIFLAKLWLPSFILIASEGWGEKEIFTKGVGDRQEQGRGGGGGGKYYIFHLSPSPPLTTVFISKSNMGVE